MINELPTAFPWTHEKMTCTGMTLRDYFAAKAMQAMLSQDLELSQDLDYHQRYKFFDLADYSYRCADAMIKAREQ